MDSAFLVTCLGAYEDSGIGTGGCILISKNKEIFELDSFDSTGLMYLNGNYYRYIRALKKLVVYTQEGLKAAINLPYVSDVHDIAYYKGEIVIVSTGNNEIQWYDMQFNLIKRWNPGGTNDAWHLNCLCVYQDELYVTAFGAFEEHRAWNGNSKQQGFLMKVNTQEKVVTKLSGPHTPRMIDGQWWVCDSHDFSVKIADINEVEPVNSIYLGRFTRGACSVNDKVFIGLNSNRKNPKDINGSIALIDKNSYRVLEKIPIPFPEIYDILPIDDELYESIISTPEKFKIIDNNDTAIKNLKEQLKLTEFALAVQKRKNHGLKRYIPQSLKNAIRKFYS